MRVFQITELDKKTLKKAHKTADKILDKPKAKSNIAKWAKDKGMDPEGAVYAIATNMAKKKTNEENWLSKAWDTIKHGMGDDMDLYVEEVNKVLRRYGTQGTLRHLKKKFPDAAPTDLQKAIKIVLSRG